MNRYSLVVTLFCVLVAGAAMAMAHDGHEHLPKGAKRIHTTIPINAAVAPPEIAAAFEPFAAQRKWFGSV